MEEEERGGGKERKKGEKKSVLSVETGGKRVPTEVGRNKAEI